MNYPYGRSSHFEVSPSQFQILLLVKWFNLIYYAWESFPCLPFPSCITASLFTSPANHAPGKPAPRAPDSATQTRQSSRDVHSVEVNEQPRMISSGNQSLTTQRTSIHFVWRYDRWSAPTLVLLLVPGIHLNFPFFSAFIFNRPSVKFFEFRQSYCVFYLVLSKSNSSTQRPVCSHQELIKCWIAL